MTHTLKVDIWSDVQCPWCYIGKRKFEQALKLYGKPVEVEYHSFELAPDTPEYFDGSPVDYLSKTKGLSIEQVNQMISRVTDIAADVGLTYDYDQVKQTNTVRAHELLHYAKELGKQSEMKERLLSAYFTEGVHIGKIENLARLAGEIGMDPDEVTKHLTDRTYLNAVKEDVAQAQAYGISGVPFFVIDGKYGISGAQASETFVSALEEASRSVTT